LPHGYLNVDQGTEQGPVARVAFLRRSFVTVDPAIPGDHDINRLARHILAVGAHASSASDELLHVLLRLRQRTLEGLCFCLEGCLGSLSSLGLGLIVGYRSFLSVCEAVAS